MSKIVFDSGPVISLALNNLLWLLAPLKKASGANFFITEDVKHELVDRPLQIKRFKFEALQTMEQIREGVIEVVREKGEDVITTELIELANHVFKARGEWIKLVHYAEMQSMAYALMKNADAFVVDEKTTRFLVENPEGLKNRMEHKLHTKITTNKDYLKRFQKKVKSVRMIRSVELVVVAYEMGLLNRFLPDTENAKEELLDSVLWGMKMNGCAVSPREIEQIIKIESPGR
jgi:hypothetical protein